MTFRLLDLRLILRAVAALALLAVFALTPASVSLSGVALAQTADPPEEPCSGNGYDPAPVDVEVEAVPIVVESTVEEYFMLYVRHDLDAYTTVELPVSVTLGADGTTSLAENVAALPKERYRVEKYNVADPADIDGDCIDDITELADPVGMNPVNPAPAIDISDGAVAVPDRETFEKLSYAVGSGVPSSLKFVVLDMDTARPRVYFQNTKKHQGHSTLLDTIGIDRYQDGLLRGTIAYDPELLASDGSPGVYYYGSNIGHQSFSLAERIYTLLAASMPVLEDNLALHMPNWELPHIQPDLPLYRESRINLVFDEEILPETSFLPLNPGEGYGLLRVMEPDERPNPRDVVIYEALPNELPRVAGIVSTVPQTPLSHVNLRAVQDGIPNAFIRSALDEPAIEALLGSYVHYTVTESGYSIRAATRAEVDAHYAASRPAAEQTPQRDFSVTEITALSDIEFEDWTAFGVKAANVAVLGTLDFPAGTVPDGFAVPFYFYDEFMKANDLYTDVNEMLADPDFQTDFATQEKELKKLRKKIKNGTTPAWIITVLEEMHAEFPEGTSLRYRSSTNNEDLPGFNGAGLYDSKTQDPDETEEDGIDKSIKGVWKSLWNFRAFIERDFHRIDHTAAAMGVLVHPNYSGELANGVAVSFDPVYGTDENYYVNTQVGEELVTNPDALSVPEEILLYQSYIHLYRVVATSNQVPPGQLIMSDEQLEQLRRHLAVIHEEFGELYGIGDGERFAMEIEFKITSNNILAIKQARPWVFEGATTTAAAPGDATLSGLTLSGVPFTFASDTTSYVVNVANDVDQTMVTATANDGGATYVVKLGGVTDEDSVVPLAVGSNVITVEVTAEDGNTSKTYTVTVTRAASSTAPDAPDRPTGQSTGEGAVSLDWNDVPTATSYVVRVWQVDSYTELSADASVNGISITFNGSSATVSGLPTDYDWYYFQVSAVNDAGASGWSPNNAIEVTRAEPSSGAAVAIGLSPSGPVEEGTEVTITMSFGGLERDSDPNDVDYIFRADVVSRPDGNSADVCEGEGIGSNRNFNQVDEDPEVRTGAVSASCAPGDYTVEVSISSSGNVELASATADFTVNAPGQQQSETPPLTGLTISPGTLTPAFSPTTYDYTVSEITHDDTVSTITVTVESGYSVSCLVCPRDLGNGVYEIWNSVGVTIIDLRVTDDSTNISKWYTITVTRPEQTITISGLAEQGYLEEYTQAIGTYTGPPEPRNHDGPWLQWSLSGEDSDDFELRNSRTVRIWPGNGKTYDNVVKLWFAETPDYENPDDADEDNVYKVTIEAINANFISGSLDVTVTVYNVPEPVNTPATGAPTIGGKAQVGETLTASTSGIADPDGLTGAAYSYQWIANDGSADVEIQGATGATFTLRSDDAGKIIKVRVSFTDDGGFDESLTSAPTAVVAASPDSGPAVAIDLSPSGSVEPGTAITATMTFGGLESDSDTSTTDYTFRADVVNADACEGGGMGNDRYMYKVDEDPEVRTGSISTSCAPGDYTVEVSILSPGNAELASATADFTVATPAQQQQQPEPPASTDATLSNLALSNVDFGVFTSSTTGYAASVANGVDETAVTPTVNDDGATYAIKLGGVTDADGVIPLAVGSNVITVEVTAEDGNTAKTYTVTVTRAAPPLSPDATLSSLTLSDAPFTFASDTTSYDVSVANGVDQTTVTATANHGGASYAVKLGGVADEDGTVELSVGSNVIAVEVTAEDGKTTKTYTVTVNRADSPPPSSPQPVEPEEESTGKRSAWLEQNPENKPFVGEWQHFTLRGSGLDEVDLSVNVISLTGARSSTGAVGYATASPLPAVEEVCGSAYYSGYQMSVDRTFSLVGCREGTVIIELLDPGNDYALLKRYTVTVNAGP